MPERVKLAIACLWLQAVSAAVIAALVLRDAASLADPRRLPDGSTMPAPLQDQLAQPMLLELGKVVGLLAVALIVGAVAAIVRRSWARWLAVGGELPLLLVSLLMLHNGLDHRSAPGIGVALALTGTVVIVLRSFLSRSAAVHYSGGSSPERMSSASTMR